MALVLKKLYQGYFWLSRDLADPRSDDFIISSPLAAVALVFSYVYAVKFLGPELMRNRKPFNLKILLILYNVLQIVANFYLMYEGACSYKKIGWSCVPVDYSRSSVAMAELGSVRKFFWLKMFDWIDTIFFVLRKSNRQITFLHVYHHAGMVLLGWIALKYLGGGHSLFVVLLNLPVHGVMFTYYLLTTIDSKWKQNISVKRFLTQIQMVQFLGFIFIYGRILFQSNCPYPKFLCSLFVVQNMFMFILFGDFYRKTYTVKPKHQEKLKQN
ncbi:very long chain fatty acid elongase AAEL008004 isoform X1 [Leptinotarsa decemlineata]|uniref:very long chain fatty acid elongase AAEL008004 isoform X1 n=1 Tax=Leptinotarsa decemlineata TaxID=7539 RepID=UPI003D3075B0